MAQQKSRADELVVTRNLAESRNKAQALILAGQLRFRKAGDSEWQPVKKPGQALSIEVELDLLPGKGQQDVGRGAQKLRGAFEYWPALEARARGGRALDIGSSTGGFTQILLEKGAERVVALDVGTHQLHERLRADARVVSVENQHVLQMTPEIWARIGEAPPFDFIVTDVSFISVTRLVGAVAAWLREGAPWIVLVKPQFEVGAKKAPRGIVRDPRHQQEALDLVRSTVQSEASLEWKDFIDSPILGGEGNKEFLAWIEKKPSSL